MDTQKLVSFYQKEIEENFWPFWEKAFDEEAGGVFTCFSNDGSTLVSKDKYTWSQGRFLWLCAELYRLAEQGKIALSKNRLKKMADKTYLFLVNHTVMENNHVLYTVTDDGKPVQEDISVFADCFFVIGVNKYADVFKNEGAFDQAYQVYESIHQRIEEGHFRTEPYPIPVGYSSHSIQMIMLNVAQEVEETAEKFSKPIQKKAKSISKKIMQEFILEDGRIIELKPEDASNEDTLLANHVNPGHALESIWFHVHSLHERDEKVLQLLSKVTLQAIHLGWDEEHGGLLRFVDKNGAEPQGRRIDDPYEKLILDTWDTKLWWPHSEALYTLLLLYKKTKEERFLEWYKTFFEYSFTTFPNPNKEIGEWIQIRDRQGRPLQKVVALPVKDPFHILRNFILILKLF
ncbi:AGE family epimerase/isomerase [Fredinandcohnia sp. QZ13]|uniref:AGE family epimerase/isomerase n=1 Tax=Fredinandcohnia sp. QZ13 TaxID=3073144 RepID=UPI0028532B13|nr:AGE family epimerase/isomerase [Fredinandcohnia sp. QZ13]MDR4890126.1 AGE family epimerase/isomerase [Fredinandcohnia sp. QZ13]